MRADEQVPPWYVLVPFIITLSTVGVIACVALFADGFVHDPEPEVNPAEDLAIRQMLGMAPLSTPVPEPVGESEIEPWEEPTPFPVEHWPEN